jgi:hypothetical protein
MDRLSEALPQIPMTMTFTPPQGGGEATWVCDPPCITVDPRDSVILVITLETGGSTPLVATYDPTDALVWVPPAPPAWALGWWLNDPVAASTVLNVKSINQGRTAKGTWDFVVNVMYDGQLYTSPDPTIINIEPTGTLEEVEEVGRVLAKEVGRVIAEAHRLVA